MLRLGNDALAEQFRFFRGHNLRTFATVTLNFFSLHTLSGFVALLLLPCEFLLPLLE
jgi:hypothetical protein